MALRSLEGEVALVTGAGRRIGRGIALELARAGADVVVHVNRSRAEGEEVAAAIRKLGRRAAVVRADQRKPREIERACASAAKALGVVTILVNSAATWPQCDFLAATQEDFDVAIEVNLRGPFFWARFVAAGMKRADGNSPRSARLPRKN